MLPPLFLVCLLTFIHYTAAQMRGPIIPLYAAAHGATATGVGIIVAAHMATAGVGSIPFGRAADMWGRRSVLLGGMVLGALASALLPFAERVWTLATIYGIAGLGIAAFSPSALSLVSDAASPGRIGRAFAWYSTAHYGAIGVGPFIGGLVAERWGHAMGFTGSALGIVVGFIIAAITLRPQSASPLAAPATWTSVCRNKDIWAGWMLAASGLFVQGTLFTFLPLLMHSRGSGPGAIGLAFLVLGLANTAVRIPAGWLIDRSGRTGVYAFGGVGFACMLTMLVPLADRYATLIALVAMFGAASGAAFVAVSVALTASATPSSRGLVMGGYSTALYLGLGLGSLATGPVISLAGYEIGFAVSGLLGTCAALAAASVRSRTAQVKRSPVTTEDACV